MMTGDETSKSNYSAKKKGDYQPPWQKKATVVEAAASALANVTVRDASKNRDFTYLAVDKLSKICSRCYPDDGKVTNKCERWCYQNQCAKCGYYGHKMSTCLQSHKVTGEKIDR